MGIRLFNLVIINEKTTLTGSFPSSHSDDTVNKECHTAACTLQSDDTRENFPANVTDITELDINQLFWFLSSDKLTS